MVAHIRTFAVITLAASIAGCGSGGKNANGDGGAGCDSYRRFPCSTSPSGLCDVDGNPAQPLTLSEMDYIRSHCTGQD